MPRLTIKVVDATAGTEEKRLLLAQIRPREYDVAAPLSDDQIKTVQQFLKGLFIQEAIVVHRVGSEFELEVGNVNSKAYEVVDQETKKHKKFANFDEVLLYLLTYKSEAIDDYPIRDALKTLDEKAPGMRQSLVEILSHSALVARNNEAVYQSMVEELHPDIISTQLGVKDRKYGIQILTPKDPPKITIKFMDSPDHFIEGNFASYADILRYVFTHTNPGNIAYHFADSLLKKAEESTENFRLALALINNLYPADFGARPKYVEDLLDKLNKQAEVRAAKPPQLTAKLKSAPQNTAELQSRVPTTSTTKAMLPIPPTKAPRKSLKSPSDVGVIIKDGEISFSDRLGSFPIIEDDKEPRAYRTRTIKYLIPNPQKGPDMFIEREIARIETKDKESGRQIAYWIELNILPQGDPKEVPNGLCRRYPDKVNATDEIGKPYYFKVDKDGNELKLIDAKLGAESLNLRFRNLKTGAETESSVLITPNRDRIPSDLLNMTKPNLTPTSTRTTPIRRSRA